MYEAIRRLATRIAAVVLLVLGLVLWLPAASYAGPPVAHSVGTVLTLTSWPTILAGLVGLGSTELTALLTHHRAPQWIKSGVHLAFSTLGAVLINLAVIAGATWRDYVAEIAVAWGTGLLAHLAGLTAIAQAATSGQGIGEDAKPLVNTVPSTTDDQGGGAF